MNSKDFFTQKPVNKFLQKHIAYYYFQECSGIELPPRYTFYPHYKNALSIYKQSKVNYRNNLFTVEPDQSINYFYGYSSVHKEFQEVIQYPPFYKIGIVFQPLGINHFLKENLVKLKGQGTEFAFNYFAVSMKPFLDEIYTIEQIEKKVELLDAYFESQYIGFKEPRLEKAVELLLNTDEKYTVKGLAEILDLSRKTLLRLFQKHLCCSVKEYINVIQFRKALLTYQLAQEKPLLTSLAYDIGYYDQSEFINHFKKITGFNPSKILGNIQKLGDEDTFWTIP